ncbi:MULTISPECIES: hypothetical protein [Roseateles]|nr:MULTISPECIES: hypothetical protein [Roseateles]WIV96207.1 hypothetical protein K9V56_014265 [Paucibacter aquatile]
MNAGLYLLALLLLLPSVALAGWMWWTLAAFHLEDLQLAEIGTADWEA